jgi:hypothetical protein
MNCKKLIEAGKKSKHRSKWLKSEIKKLEDKTDKTRDEQRELCILYSVLTSVPLTNYNPIYELCTGCEFERLFCYGEM